MDGALRRFAIRFKIDFNISLMASRLGWVDAATVDVLQDVFFLGGELMGADGPAIPLEEGRRQCSSDRRR